MKRGDTNLMTFKLYKIDTTPKEYIDGSIYDDIEVQLNPQAQYSSVKKLKSKDEVEWDSTNQVFVVGLTQEDTFKLPTGETKMQVRLLLNDVCKASAIVSIDVGECLSSEVLDD